MIYNKYVKHLKNSSIKIGNHHYSNRLQLTDVLCNYSHAKIDNPLIYIGKVNRMYKDLCSNMHRAIIFLRNKVEQKCHTMDIS